MRIIPWVLVLFASCKPEPPREAYVVGTYIGGGSSVFGSSSCTYAVRPATVAELAPDRKGPVLLLDEGEIDRTCGDTTDTFDVVKPDGLRIDGRGGLGANDTGEYEPVTLAGSRTLNAQTGELRAEWTLGPDCDGIVRSEVDLGAGQDYGGGTYRLQLWPIAKGTCTITASVMDLTATKTITVL